MEAQTTAFRSQCQGLLSEQQRLSSVADDVASNLQYYNYLEPMTRRLNAPGAGQFVRNKEFSEMLSNLDNCIDYMQAHVITPQLLSSGYADHGISRNTARLRHIDLVIACC